MSELKFSNKKFLVTGGAGFIGSALARRLYYENSSVVVIDDFSVGNKNNLSPAFETIEDSIAHDLWKNKLRDIDYILHFGSPSSVVLFKKSQNKCLEDTIVGTANIFEYAKLYGVKKVIYPSSSSVYGDTPLPQSETTPTFPTNMYGVAKLACEHIARLYADCVASVGLRIFAGYGPGESHKKEIASVITLFMKAIAYDSNPLIFGDGTQSRDFVYIDDIVEAVLKSVEGNFVGTVNIGSGRSETFKEAVDLINSLMGKNIDPVYVEKPSHYFEHTLADTKKMREWFGLSPLSLENGLQRYLEVLEESR